MTPASFLAFIADLRGLHGDLRRQRLGYVIERLGLASVLKQNIETLSKGFKRRVGLAQAVLHDPRVLILDEPTDGLDPNQKHEVRELIRDMSSDKIIIISTHILEEVDAVCTRALIIAEGKLLADDTPDNLAARSPLQNSVFVGSQDNAQASCLYEALGQMEDVAAVRLADGATSLKVLAKPGKTVLGAVQQLLAARDWTPESLHVERGRLDEVFREITGGRQL